MMESFNELKQKAGMTGNGIKRRRKKLTRKVNFNFKKKKHLDIFDQE